jgi:hypothetical protein
MIVITNIIGVIGVFFVLLAYFLLQCGKTQADSLRFLLCNLLGAAMILFSLIYDWNLSAALIEAAWMLISLFGIVRVLLKRARYKAGGL